MYYNVNASLYNSTVDSIKMNLYVFIEKRSAAKGTRTSVSDTQSHKALVNYTIAIPKKEVALKQSVSALISPCY